MRTLAILAVLGVLVAPLDAQDRSRTRSGFWAGVGVGAGSIGADCAGCSTNRVNGPAGHVRLGTTLTRKLLLGVELAGWSLNYQGVDQSVGSGMIDLFWYPSRTGGFYLKFGGGGLAYESTRTVLGSPVTTTETAGALTVGAGYDVRVSGKVSIVPFVNGYGSSAVTRRVNDVEVITNGDVRRDMVQLGVGITLH